MRSNLGILGLLSLALIFAVVQYSEANSLITVHKTITPPSINWTAACINFPCKTTKDLFKSSKKFIQTHNIGTRLQIYDGCIYVAYPRYKTGVPMTLGVSCKFEGCGATFDPYPCWSYHEEGNCDALQSVSDFKIDQNGLLWVLDTGIIYSMDNPTRTCGPKIVVFNARTKKVVRVIKLDQLTVPQSRLQYLLVDYSESGRCFVYISDAATRSVIVYDVQARRGYRLVLPGSVLKGFGKKDVLYLALTTCSEKNRLYFTYLSSRKVYYIDVENLRQGNSRGKIIGEFQVSSICFLSLLCSSYFIFNKPQLKYNLPFVILFHRGWHQAR